MTGFPSPRAIKQPNPFQAVLTGAQVRWLRQRARLAQARKDWPTAVRLWRSCAEKAPDRFHRAGYLSALIYAGQIDEAEAEAKAHLHHFPADATGQIALGRIAEARGDVHEATAHWRAALELQPGNRQALIRLGTALLALKRLDEAHASVSELRARYPGEPHGAILQAQVTQEQQGFAQAAPQWRAAADRFPGDRFFLRAHGRALLLGGAYNEAGGIADRLAKLDLAESLRLRGQVLAKQKPFQDHTAFWQSAAAQLPDNADITRKLVHAALWGRRIEQAESALRQLLSRHRSVAEDADFVVGLANAYLVRNDRASARHIVRSFLKALRGKPDYRAAALRLNRLILTCFPQGAGSGLAISRNQQRFLRMVRSARLARGAAEPLAKIAELETALQQSGADCLLDSDIEAECGRAFVRLVRERLAGKRPFSLIRLGDGEANAFQSTTSLAARSESDAAEREMVWWGRTLTPEGRGDLASRVREAAFDADALGFPNREWFLRDVRLDSGPPLSSTKSGRGLLAVAETLQAVCGSGALSGKTLVSAHLPQDLLRWGLYGELLNGSGEVVLVSCHPNLPQVLEDRFAVRAVHHVLMPPGDSMREKQHRALSDDELPPRGLDYALDALGAWPEGRLVLVGAGYAGKVVIGEAKRRGGIALDLGSIFDHWMGANTRSYQDLA